MTRILVIDNYDSFVFTLVGYLQQLGAETTVIRNDEYDLDEVIKLAEEHDGVLVSPGPGAPAEAGVIIDTIRWAAEAKKPLRSYPRACPTSWKLPLRPITASSWVCATAKPPCTAYSFTPNQS